MVELPHLFGPVPTTDEPLIERGLIDEIAPAASGDIASLDEGRAPGSPRDPVTPPETAETHEEPLIPAVNPVSH